MILRLDYIFFGYRVIKIEESELPRALTYLLGARMQARTSEGGEIVIPERSLSKYRKALRGINYSVSECLGVLGFLKRNRNRYGLALGILALLVYYILTIGRVWDVRVSGNEEITTAQIKSALADSGLSEGARWGSFSRSEVEMSVLKNYPELSWINVNRRGVVAYVDVREMSGNDVPDKAPGFSNVVSAVDCVIEEITVVSGVAKVSAGETVKKGQILISGVLPAELGGGFTRASGIVKGRVSESAYVKVGREEEILVSAEKELSGLSVTIFGKTVNILKKYGNLDMECDIIETTDKYVAYGGRVLPFSLNRSYIRKKVTERVVYTDEQLVKIAHSRLASMRLSVISDGELISVRTDGGFDGDGYFAKSDMFVVKDVCEEKIIQIG